MLYGADLLSENIVDIILSWKQRQGSRGEEAPEIHRCNPSLSSKHNDIQIVTLAQDRCTAYLILLCGNGLNQVL